MRVVENVMVFLAGAVLILWGLETALSIIAAVLGVRPMKRKATAAALLCALALAGCAAPVQTQSAPSRAPLTAEEQASYCQKADEYETALSHAMQHAYEAGDASSHLDLQLQLLDFLGKNPGGCYPQWWADARAKEAAALRAASVNG